MDLSPPLPQRDGMEGYGWTLYDTRTGGSQTIHDSVLHLDLTTEFFKSDDGLSWSARVKGVPRADAPASPKTALIFHAALENAETLPADKTLKCTNDASTGADESVKCTGAVPELGSVDLHQIGDAQNKIIQGPAVKSVSMAEDKIWQAKAVFSDVLKATEGDSLVVNEPGEGNMHFSQLVLEGPFSITFAFRSNTGTFLPSDAIDNLGNQLNTSFAAILDKVFPRTAPYEGDAYEDFTRSLISNLLGGMGFFHGDEKVDETHAPEYEELDLNFWEKAAEKWLNLMDEDGWIGREQILGLEARSKVPTEFQTQYPHYANPPTLSLLLTNIISKVTKKTPYNGHSSKYTTSSQDAQSLVKELLPLFDRHYNWFRRTQAGNLTAYSRPGGVNSEAYRWKGRYPGHTLTSGLDDYPRAEPPHPGELHVDALAWVGASARALQQAAEFLGEDSSVYKGQLDAVLQNLDVIHWNTEQSAYCDSTIGGDGQFQHVSVLDLISDSQKVLSPFGLRSLSAADEKYGTEEDYWRGAVWMPLNVLAVLRLHGMGSTTSEGKRANALAAKLRKRLVNTVYDSWKSTGFVWEQYNDKTGAGQRSRAFTGWTACIILLMGLEDAAPSMADSDAPEACRRFGGRCRSWYLERTRQVEGYEVIDLDDLHESDTEERSR
ncbi:hypothetical protein J7T55_002386 [Diaporthe amygdali]|uniref:uncharacterized protein n=1 Tax=Phomopsis amygdali TaxID=1214568 RepID=UPI0022FE99F0|nr:uncharacterized protein J7T55_002386 [Diaporthe amygdali]KAJ0121877.1 hypothetical protein J7T55_002386 [Diaporthe amygdali]